MELGSQWEQVIKGLLSLNLELASSVLNPEPTDTSTRSEGECWVRGWCREALDCRPKASQEAGEQMPSRWWLTSTRVTAERWGEVAGFEPRQRGGVSRALCPLQSQREGEGEQDPDLQGISAPSLPRRRRIDASGKTDH